MKTKFFLLIFIVLLTIKGRAAPIDEPAARTVVQDFLISMNGQCLNTVPILGRSGLQLVHAEMSSVSVTMNAYYIFNTGDGYVIVAGDDRAEQILGYGDGDFDMNNIPCGLQVMLNRYKEQIDYLFEHPGLVVETSSSLNAPMLTTSSISPLLRTDWGQDKPFFNQCPLYNERLCVTGCCCTALSQVMYYWKHPASKVPSLPSYSYNTWIGHENVSITVPALPSISFDWVHMIDSYNYYNIEDAYTSTQADAVAWLMRYVGQAEHMIYTPSESGASTTDVLRAAKMFGYNFNAHWVWKSDYSNSQWASMIQTELRAGRPLVYRACGTDGGHVFNLDGYNASTNKYHINWGWDGFFNDYYALDAFDLPFDYYNIGNAFIIGLEPQQAPMTVGPEIEITPLSLTFKTEAGKTDWESIIVTGYNLTNNLTVTLNDRDSVFSIDETRITKNDATYGCYVTVRYKPTKVGTNNASVTISGGGAASKTVNLSGTATGPLITVTPPISLSMEALVGETTTQIIRVQGSDLTSDLILTLNDTSGIFSIDKTKIIRTEAINGVDVTVTCTPKKGYRHGNLTISGGGAEPVRVGLTGQGLEPTIYVNPANLSFESLVGDTITKTFTVIGCDLITDILLQLNDTSCCYSLDYTTIKSKDAEDDGIEVTVTYCPKTRGSNSASVVLTSRSADTKIVELNGIALQPQIILNPESLLFYSGLNHTAIQSFKVKGDYLLGDLSLTLNDSLGIYSISTTNITQTGSHTYAEVKVTYNPMFAGPSSAFVTISGGGAETMALSLIGMAKELPVINVDTDSIYLKSAYVGCQSSKSLAITCSDLQQDLQLSLIYDDSNSFELSKQIVSPEEAADGAEVIVYFNPTSGGKKNARLNICYDGYEAVSIPVSGIAKTSGNIIVSPTVLLFDTQLGTSVTQTFKVTSVNTIDDLTVTLNDTSGIYSIDKTTIAKSGEDNVSQSIVTVTYHPMKTGTDTATVTISGTGVEPKTVRLSGVAEGPPSVNVDVNSLSFESTYTGYQTSRTITITCPDLTDSLELSISRDNTNSFGLSKSVITPEAAAAGAPVTVYFSPTSGGGKHAAIDIKYDGCKVASIPVSGVGIKSDGYITAWPTSLEFEAQPGTAVTKMFNVSYSYPNGSIMISSVGSGGEAGLDTEVEAENAMPTLNASHGLGLVNTIIPFGGNNMSSRFKDLIGPFEPGAIIPYFNSLVLELTGDDCFEITPTRISLQNVPCSAIVTVTYHPECEGDNYATIKIKKSIGSAKPFILPLHGSATGQLNAPSYDNDGNDLMTTQSGTSINILVNEMLMNIKVYAEGQNIIIESPEADNAIISDIAGYAKTVNLQAGRNVIPVNASGIYIVRIREKTTKLMLK